MGDAMKTARELAAMAWRMRSAHEGMSEQEARALAVSAQDDVAGNVEVIQRKLRTAIAALEKYKTKHTLEGNPAKCTDIEEATP